MKDSNRNQMTREQQEAKCWDEYYASNKTPEQIEAEVGQAWEEYFENQNYDSESLSEDSEEGSTYEGEAIKENCVGDEPDMRIYKKRKRTAVCHKALFRKAEVAKRNLRKRQEDDAQNHRKVVRKRKKKDSESEDKPVKSVVRRGARATNSRSGRAVTLINKAKTMGYTVE